MLVLPVSVQVIAMCGKVGAPLASPHWITADYPDERFRVSPICQVFNDLPRLWFLAVSQKVS